MNCFVFRVDGVLRGPSSGLLSLLGLGGRRPCLGRHRASHRRPRATIVLCNTYVARRRAVSSTPNARSVPPNRTRAFPRKSELA